MVARFKSTSTEPDYRVLRGCWVGSGMACRVWYIQNGRVKMVFAEGMMTHQIDKAIRTQSR